MKHLYRTLFLGLLLFLRPLSIVDAQEPATTSVPEVAVVKAVRGNLAKSLNLTAEFQPYQVVDIHAKVSGYIKQILVDVGDSVHQGQTIAVLEIPEIDADIAKAQASLLAAQQQVKSAQALYDDADLMFTRLENAAKSDPHLIAQQEIDTSQSMEESKQADLQAANQKVDEAKAEVARFQALIDYSTVTAPFDGIVTKRFLNTGALVQGGTTGTNSIPLVTIAQMNHLRLIFPVPEAAVSCVSLGTSVDVSLISSARTFTAAVSRFSHNVDLDTRTMHTEADVDNADGKIYPGTYATVVISLANKQGVLVVPIQAIIPGDHPSVLILNAQGQVEQKTVTVGIETANRAEITSGLQENDLVIVGSHTVQVGQNATAKIIDSNSL
jgi:RND family efflux transporter MFP subunit